MKLRYILSFKPQLRLGRKGAICGWSIVVTTWNASVSKVGQAFATVGCSARGFRWKESGLHKTDSFSPSARHIMVADQLGRMVGDTVNRVLNADAERQWPNECGAEGWIDEIA